MIFFNYLIAAEFGAHAGFSLISADGSKRKQKMMKDFPRKTSAVKRIL
jgi:hypothetical protein